MKNLILSHLSVFIKVLTVFFYPIKGIIVLVTLSVLLDTIFGIWKAKKLKEKITSKKARKGFVPKLLSYIGVIMLIYMCDFFIINDFTKMIIDFDFLSTKFIALALFSIEVKSIDESYKSVKGRSFIDKITSFFIKARNFNKEIKDSFKE
jgi:hypothetical protein